MATYSDLRTRIADDLIDSAVTTSHINTEIQNAIRHYRRERFYFNEEQATASTVASTQTVGLPSDFVFPTELQITVNGTTWKLRERSVEQIRKWSANATTGQPSDYAIYEQQIILYPIPDTIYTVTLDYVKQLADLSNDSDSNAWTTEGEELIRSRAEWSLWDIIVRDDNMAAKMKAREMEAYASLKRWSERYSGPVSIAPNW